MTTNKNNTPNSAASRKTGRGKKIEITDEMRAQVEKLAGIGCTWEEIAYVIGGMSTKTLQRYCTEDYHRGTQLALATVKQGLWKLIQQGDKASIMFYLKTRAGWKETTKSEITGKDGAPIETKSEQKVTAELTPEIAEAISRALEKQF